MIEIAFPREARMPFCTLLVSIVRDGLAREDEAPWAREQMMDDDRAQNVAAPGERRVTKASRRVAQPARRRLIARLWQNAERQVEEIEARLKGAEGTALEQSAKALAVLTRAVRDLVAIDGDMKPDTAAKGDSDDRMPPARLYEDFRNELAGRLESLLGERGREPASGGTEL